MSTSALTLDPVDRRVRSGRNWTKADVFRRSEGGATLAVKSVRSGSALRRFGVAGLLLRRERRMLERLASLGGVPRVVCADRDELTTEWVEGETVGQRGRVGISACEADHLRAAVARLHAAGFAHGGIGRTDLMVTRDGAILIDFATAVGPGAPPLLGRLLAAVVRVVDRRRLEVIVTRSRLSRFRRVLMELAAERDPGAHEAAS